MSAALTKTAAALAVSLLAAFGPAAPVAAQEIIIGTGSHKGLYYQAGRIICRMINRMEPVDGMTCTALSTPGSVANLANVRAGNIQVGVVQSDKQVDAVNGTGSFAATGPDDTLRSLFSMHTEPFTLVARKKSGIESLADLPGKRVNIGNPGSGQRGTMEAVMKAMGWTKKDFAKASQLAAAEHSFALCTDRVDAIVYTVGHPNPSIAHATGLCDASIIEVSGPEIDALVASSPYFVNAVIPGGVYPANAEPVTSFGVIGTVVVSESMDDETAYQIVAHVFDNLEQIRKTHPAFAALDPVAMIRDGLSAPMHPGAERYYVEKGLMKELSKSTN